MLWHYVWDKKTQSWNIVSSRHLHEEKLDELNAYSDQRLCPWKKERQKDMKLDPSGCSSMKSLLKKIVSLPMSQNILGKNYGKQKSKESKRFGLGSSLGYLNMANRVQKVT